MEVYVCVSAWMLTQPSANMTKIGVIGVRACMLFLTCQHSASPLVHEYRHQLCCSQLSCNAVINTKHHI